MGPSPSSSSRRSPVAEPLVRAELAEAAFAPAQLLARFLQTVGPEAGAVVTFAGLARGRGKDGSPLSALFLEHHPVLTRRSLEEVAGEGAQRFAVGAVEVVHRCGAIQPGEPIVWVATAAAHRRAAFDAADYLMDRLKTEAVFWKREDGAGGSAWIEPTDDDYAARKDWD